MSCGGRNDFRLGQMHKEKLFAAGTLHDVIPCDVQTFIDAHQGVTTLSALQAIPTLPIPQLATHHSTVEQQHTTSPMLSLSATPPSDFDPFLYYLDLNISYNNEAERCHFFSKGALFSLRRLVTGFVFDTSRRTLTEKGGKERGLINCMARSDCKNDYKVFAMELSITKPVAVEYLNGIDKSHWVKYKYQETFNHPTYDETTSNLAEQANNWIGNDCRSAKPLEAFSMHVRKLSELVSRRRQLAAKWLF
ncbi:unnamed protein product [Phytophthora fragariaefolia]|uniref:Unnamed protein product n=1 Tax=Phytophthora fragariaefolia TaxID=1490495 RepID=A0A9W6TY77_9STRA|nr:unnamed protein product [Phytophthora fragariaefolia]